MYKSSLKSIEIYPNLEINGKICRGTYVYDISVVYKISMVSMSLSSNRNGWRILEVKSLELN